jgi:hypothetical protein
MLVAPRPCGWLYWPYADAQREFRAHSAPRYDARMKAGHPSIAAALVAAALLAAPAADAHHSFAAMFDSEKPIRLVGRLVSVEWVNPHAHFDLEVLSRTGQVSVWSVEGAGPGTLSRRGFVKGTVKVGDMLTVDGYLARSGRRIIDGQRVQLPDGRVFQTGSEGQGAPDAGAPKPAGPAQPATH